MANPYETVERVRKMNYAQLLEAAGLVPPIKPSTYLYVDTDGAIVHISMDSGGTPSDEYSSIGFANKLNGR